MNIQMKTYNLHHDDTKIRILFAAKKEFAAKGFNGARMSSIAAIAGVNQALIHYYFSTKENIYKNIFQIFVADFSEKYSAKFWSELDLWETGPELKLCAAIYMLIYFEQYFYDDEIERMIVREIAEGNGIFYDYIVNQYLILQLSSFEKIIKDGVDKGLFETSDTSIFSTNIILLIWNLAHDRIFLKYTGLSKEIFEERNEVMYKFVTELSFKALKTLCGELNIPDLDETRKKTLNSILNELRGKLNNLKQSEI